MLVSVERVGRKWRVQNNGPRLRLPVPGVRVRGGGTRVAVEQGPVKRRTTGQATEVMT
jgi:hypothetical protein